MNSGGVLVEDLCAGARLFIMTQDPSWNDAVQRRRSRPCRGHLKVLLYRTRWQEIGDLSLVCFPLVTSAPEPVLHSGNGGSVLVEDHFAEDSVRIMTQGPSCTDTVQRCRITAVSGSS